MTLAARAQAHYPNNPAYQAAWIKIVTFLGDKWLLATPVPKS